MRIAADPTGIPWVVNSQGQVYHRGTNGQWQQAFLGSNATDISIGGDGTVAIVSGSSKGSPKLVFADGKSAVLPGGGNSVAVDPNGYPWVLNSAGHIYSSSCLY